MRSCARCSEEPALAAADVLLLAEVDHGMARSGNRHVARELAEALGMSYAFGVSYLVLEDDSARASTACTTSCALGGHGDLVARADRGRRERRRAGAARQVLVVGEAARQEARAGGRLGGRRPLTVAACHLDSNASPARAGPQLEAIAAAGERVAGGGALLVGGDLNTTTYDLASPSALAQEPVAQALRHRLRRDHRAST